MAGIEMHRAHCVDQIGTAAAFSKKTGDPNPLPAAKPIRALA